MRVETYQTGSTAELTYDRSNDPATKTYTATGLTYALYAFKVVAVNAIGDGLQVQPHQLLSQELVQAQVTLPPVDQLCIKESLT